MKTLEFQGKIMEKRRETMVSTSVHVEISCMSSQKKNFDIFFCAAEGGSSDPYGSWHSVAKVDIPDTVI